MTGPENQRIAELTERVREGVATDAEREELAIYGEESAEHQALMVRAQHEGELGKGWLARHQADRRLVGSERTWLSQTERKIGVGLVVGGTVATVLVPPAGIVMLGVGAGLLAWSVIRVAIKNAGKDPYEDIEE